MVTVETHMKIVGNNVPLQFLHNSSFHNFSNLLFDSSGNIQTDKLRANNFYIILHNFFRKTGGSPPTMRGEGGCSPTRWEDLESLSCLLCVCLSVSRFYCALVPASVLASVGALCNACVCVSAVASASLSV